MDGCARGSSAGGSPAVEDATENDRRQHGVPDAVVRRQSTCAAVDARVARVATRLGYGERVADFSKTARSIRLAIAPEMGPSVKNYRDAYLYFDHHGGTTCAESHPHCDECVLAKECPARQA